MQAEHIPVHLGSMPDAVAAVLDQEQRPGDSWILNDPYRGGTHLPDITLISPVFVDGELLGFAACRAHHADVGGPTPGGMPAALAHARGRGRGDPADPRRATATLRALAAQMRFPRQRLADLRAQAAANRIGALRLGRAGRAPRPRARCAPGMEEILAYAERRTRAALGASCPTATYAAEDVLEDDADGEPRDVDAAGRGDDPRRPARARLQRHRRAGRRQPQLPALGDQVGRLLRRPRADRPRRAALRRRLPADRGDRPRGLPAQRPLPGRGRRRQRRDLEPGRRPGDRRPRPAPGRCPPRARGR